MDKGSSDLRGTALQTHGEQKYKILEVAWGWTPGGKRWTRIETKALYCSHQTDRTLGCTGNFCSVNSDSEFVGKDPQIVLKNTWAAKVQFCGYRQLQSTLCAVPCAETQLNPDERLVFSGLLFKNILKIEMIISFCWTKTLNTPQSTKIWKIRYHLIVTIKIRINVCRFCWAKIIHGYVQYASLP